MKEPGYMTYYDPKLSPHKAHEVEKIPQKSLQFY